MQLGANYCPCFSLCWRRICSKPSWKEVSLRSCCPGRSLLQHQRWWWVEALPALPVRHSPETDFKCIWDKELATTAVFLQFLYWKDWLLTNRAAGDLLELFTTPSQPTPSGFVSFVFASSLITSVVSPAADVPPLQAHVTSELALLQASKGCTRVASLPHYCTSPSFVHNNTVHPSRWYGRVMPWQQELMLTAAACLLTLLSPNCVRKVCSMEPGPEPM